MLVRWCVALNIPFIFWFSFQITEMFENLKLAFTYGLYIVSFCWLPNLCAHLFFGLLLLFSTVNKDGFKPNLETHLIPLLATKLEEASSESKEKSTSLSSKTAHHPLLMQVSFFVFLQPMRE